MPPRKEHSSAESDEVALLRDEVTDLKNQVRVLSDILDEIREELQWVTRNGLPVQVKEPLSPVPVLKRMAADPCAPDWAERLVIDYGIPAHVDKAEAMSPPPPEPASAPTSSSKAPAGKLFADADDQRQLF